MADKTPQLLKGFRDFGPSEQKNRQVMFEIIRAAFERFGYQPMDTPVLEYAETLTGKYGAEEKLMYSFRDHGDRAVAMRYDLTVPMARFYLQNRERLPRPFKRYQIGPAWRADNPQKGRYREFYQCDVDVIGSRSPQADADCIAAICSALEDLGVKKYSVKLNNRKLVDGALVEAGLGGDKTLPALRIIDKTDKVGQPKTKKELEGLGMTPAQVESLYSVLKPADEGTAALKRLMQAGATAQGAAELQEVLDALKPLGIKNIELDFGMVRGADYYTGTVIEICLPDLPAFGSIAGGGRYDNLMGLMSDGKADAPAVGLSIGIDRLIAALDESGALLPTPRDRVVIFNFGLEFSKVCAQTATVLRDAGIACDLYFQPDAMDKQFKYAEASGSSLGILIGEDEVRAGTVTIRDLKTRKQRQVKAETLASEVEKSLLE